MPILTQINNTKFRSMKYGADRLNGGSSNQPYIQTSIQDKSPGTGGPDFLIRGGTLLPGRILKDVSRLTQMFVDTKSLNGILFTAKQEMLGLSEVDVNAGKDSLKSLLSVNRKVYSPTSAIAQAALTPEGIHISKQGIVPVNITESLWGLAMGKDKGRLVNLYNKHIKNISIGNVLYSYSGGPGSIEGIGWTDIKLASDRTTSRKFSMIDLVAPNAKIIGIIPSLLKKFDKLHIEETNSDPEVILLRKNDKKYRTGVSNIFNNITKTQFVNELDTSFIYSTGKAKSSADTKPGDVLKTSSPSSLPYNEIGDFIRNTNHKIRPDFRNKIDKKSPLYSKGLDYETRSIEKRINFESTKSPTGNYAIKSETAYDGINAREIYKSSGFESLNDLVKFRISVINNNDPNLSTYMHFRAYIDSFSDSYGAGWTPTHYVGRGEEFYRYGGFTREISLSWTVVAQSVSELAPMYRKLNYLASSLAPDYSPNGYMRGNIVKLTVGGYLFEQPGIVTSLVYDVPSESTWEIGVGTGEETDSKYFSQVKELPHMIKINTFKFIPIHTFVPQLYNLGNKKEQFIALSNGSDIKNTLYNY